MTNSPVVRFQNSSGTDVVVNVPERLWSLTAERFPFSRLAELPNAI